MGTSTGIIMVEKWGDVATSPEEGTTSMEVLPATRAAGEPPRPRNDEVRLTGALAARVGRRHTARFVTAAIVVVSGDTVEKC